MNTPITKTYVLYFPRNTKNKNKQYYNIYTLLKAVFEGRTSITVDEVDKFLLTFDNEKFYIKELSYQLEIYNEESEYVFCINKPIY